MNKRRIITSALVGTMALAALSISITLAWYGASDRLSVENLEVGVTGKGNLKISYSSKLDTFKESLVDTEQIAFEPVSSMHKSDWMDKKEDQPRFYESAFKSILSNGTPYKEEATVGFYRKDIYLLTTLTNQYATLDLDEEKGSKFNKEDMIDVDKNYRRAQQLYHDNPGWGLEIADIQERLDNLVNCLRISILVNEGDYYKYYIIDPTKESGDVTYLGGRLDNDKNGYYDTYLENGTGHRKEVIYGEVNDRSLIAYDDPISDTLPVDGPTVPEDQYFGNSFVAESKPTAYTYNEQNSKDNGFQIAKEDSLSVNDIKNDDSSILIPLTSGVPTKIVLSIYLEGWDLDCINATMGASFITYISFKLRGGNI